MTVPSAIAVGSAFIGVMLTNQGNAKIQDKKAESEKGERRREVGLQRGEELYVLLEEWSRKIARTSNT